MGRCKVWRSWRPHVFGNESVSEKLPQECHSFIWCVTCGAILLKSAVTFILIKKCDELCDYIPVYITIHCCLKENWTHHTPVTYSTPCFNFLKMQGFFMKHMWIFTKPHPTVLTVNIPLRWNHASSLKKTLSSTPTPCSSTNRRNHLQYCKCFTKSGCRSSWTTQMWYSHKCNFFAALCTLE